MGSSEMSQIHVLWSHFWRLLVTVDFDDGCNTKICSVDHTIIVVHINGVGYRGSSENTFEYMCHKAQYKAAFNGKKV